ncbi:MAG TPA: LytTR family DNA-binding domain-containing protein [Flavisolibacter sp.]|nr:LytTR family DNA-binding domain-containing protein [Flavisolibacter sp.]
MEKHLVQRAPKTYRRRFLAKVGDKFFTICIEDIAYIQSKDRLSLVVTFSNRKFILNDSLEFLQASLDPHIFFRINRSFIISYKAITEIQIYFSDRLIIKPSVESNQPMIVAKQRVRDFKCWAGDE